MAERELSPQGYIITKDPTNNNPFWEQEEYDPNASLPSGGTTGQHLVKKSATNFDAGWEDLPEFVTPEQLTESETALNEAVSTEKSAREQADTALSQRIDNLNIPDTSTLTADVEELKTGLTAETQARQAADTALSEQIATLDIPDIKPVQESVSGLSQTVSDLSETVTTLSETVTENDSAVRGLISSEVDAREQADTALQEAINAKTGLPSGGTPGQYVTPTTGGSYEWSDLPEADIPQASSAALGGIIANEKTDTETAEVKIDSSTGKLYAPAAESYTLPKATAEALGGIIAEEKTGSETAEVKIDPDTGKLYAPAGGGSYVLPQATASALGGIKAEEKTANETAEVKIDTSTGKLYAPAGGSGGGGIEKTLLALYGSATPALTGGTAISATTALTYESGRNWSTDYNTFKAFQIDVLTPATGEGFLSMVVGNPLYGTELANMRSYLKYYLERMAGTKVQIISTNAGFSFAPATATGGTGSITVTGVAVYGLN